MIHSTKLGLPSTVVFRDYLQKDGGNALKLQQKLTLPIKTSSHYTDLTVAAKVFHHEELSQHQLQVDTNSEDTGIKFHSDKYSHEHGYAENYS